MKYCNEIGCDLDYQFEVVFQKLYLYYLTCAVHTYKTKYGVIKRKNQLYVLHTVMNIV